MTHSMRKQDTIDYVRALFRILSKTLTSAFLIVTFWRSTKTLLCEWYVDVTLC